MTKIIRKKLLASILSVAMLISFMPAMTLTVSAAESGPYTATVNDSLELYVSELSGLDNFSDIISSGWAYVQGYTQPSSGSNFAMLYFVDPDFTTGVGEVNYLDDIDVMSDDSLQRADETIYFKADTAGEYTFYIRIDNADFGEIVVTREITVTVTNGDTTKPTLTAGAVNRTSNTTATVNFTSDTEGSYYYKVVEDGDVEPTIDTGGVGTTCTTSETTITNPTGLTAGAMDIYIIVKDGAGNESTPLKIDIDAYISSDATLKTSSTVKGEAVTSLGTPSATLGSETAGAVTITAAKAADTSNATTFVTLFEKNDSNATVKAVKYASSSSTEGFETDAAYANEAIADGDFFIIKVIAEDAVKVNYYRINVEVTPVPSTTKAITAFNFNGLTPNVIGTVNEGAKTIALTVPYGTNVTSLVPIITHTGASLSPNTGVPQNFTSPVTYTVTAADSSTQQYTVTVSVAANPINAAKSLTADTTSNSVDNDLEITFTEDAAFRSGITAISYNGNTLTASQYDTTKSGKVILKPSVSGNTYLRTPGTANVVIKSTGYNDSTVSQTINAGVVTSLEVTTQPVPGTASGDAFGTQPVVKLKDQYGNYCMTGVSATTNVVATAKAVTGAWTIGGTTTKAASGGIATFTDLTCTLTTVGNGRITFTSGSVAVDSDEFNITQNVAKILTADTTGNSVDNDIEITFASDASFEGAITGVSFNGIALTVTTDYVVGSGKVTLKPSGGNAVLRTPGTANVVITASGYGDSTVSQTINAGQVASIEVTKQPVTGAASGDAFATQPVVKLKDQYGNYCTTGVSATANVVATGKSGTGSWSIGGTTTRAATGGTATFTDLTCTLTAVGNGRITFTSGLVTVDSSEFNIPQNAAKALTADTTNNSVDNDIEITFASDAGFQSAITSVTYGGNTLTSNQYTVTSGKVTLHPSINGNNYLRTPGTGNVVITASGYGDSTVSQTINAGQVASIEVTKQPVTGAASGDAFATQPVVKLKDQYGNYCTTGVSATANVVATGKSGTGSWSIGGTTTRAATGGTATFTDLTCTLTAVGNGRITFTSGLVTVDSSEFNIPQNAAKALTADTTNNSVDNDIEITFASDAGFQSAITSVTYGGNTLTSNQYTVTSGKVTLHPSINGNNYLRTPGTGNVVITATGYGDSTVSQTINHGVIATMAVTQNIIAPASNGGNFAQQPKVTLKDAYGNTCTSDNATIVTVAKEDAGTWTLTGTTTATAISGVATFTNLGATNSTIVSNAQLGFTSGIMTKVTSTAIALPAPASSGGSGGGGGSSTTAPAGNGTVNVIVNGKTESAGTETNSTENGKSTVTVAVNNKAIESKIEEAVKSNTTGQQNVIQVPVADKKADVVRVELTGDIVKQLETNTFDVSVKRDAVEYVIPAKELTISNVAKELGVAETSLKDIKVEVKITKLDDLVVAKYNEVAKENGATIVFPPTSFEVVAKTTNAAGKTEDVKINKFSNYVERVMEIPAGVDPSKVTTGVVFNADGTYSHVPTDVYQKDGKWYARLNSLTNSNYSVVWNPVTVKSVENHWAKDAVNDMASRLVIFNADTFEPNKAITRADFAEYIVRALGLYRQGEHQNKFTDINAKGNRTLAILIANEYGIVTGYSDGTFRGNNQITREEAMTMYQRAMKITKLTGSDTNRINTYTDSAQVSKWAVSYVTDVLSAHVFNGTTATTIAPKANLTYAEAAQAIKNLLVESKLINK